jgi:hypothetical protein
MMEVKSEQIRSRGQDTGQRVRLDDRIAIPASAAPYAAPCRVQRGDLGLPFSGLDPTKRKKAPGDANHRRGRHGPTTPAANSRELTAYNQKLYLQGAPGVN